MIPVVIPWTGGADSTYLIIKALSTGYGVHPYHVNYDDYHNHYERSAIIQLTHLIRSQKTLGTLHDLITPSYLIPPLGDQRPRLDTSDARTAFDIPFRNAILFSIGIAVAETVQAQSLYLSIEDEEDPYRDHSIKFGSLFRELVRSSSPVRVEMPIAHVDIAERIRSLYEWGLWEYVRVARCKDPGPDGACQGCIMCRQEQEIFLRDYGHLPDSMPLNLPKA